MAAGTAAAAASGTGRAGPLRVGGNRAVPAGRRAPAARGRHRSSAGAAAALAAGLAAAVPVAGASARCRGRANAATSRTDRPAGTPRSRWGGAVRRTQPAGGVPAGQHRRAGQAQRRAAQRHPGGRYQEPSGRPVPAVQAQAPYPRADRPRGRARAAGRWPAGRSDAGPAGVCCQLRRYRQGRGRYQGRAGGRARDPDGALGRGRRAGG
ncbi:hypothetical protein G6F23_013180 [Rhizopus arrhizus]|nr:hypothetical protein G6F23_013180 [Rhizopus arrhizus]